MLPFSTAAIRVSFFEPNWAHIENVIVINIPGRPQDLESLTQMDRIRTKLDRNWMYKTPLVDQTKRETT